MTLQQIKEEAREEFGDKFVFSYNNVKNWDFPNKNVTIENQMNFIDSLIEKAYEEGKRENAETIREFGYKLKIKMKHLTPDLKYCKKLKGIIKECIFWTKDGKNFYISGNGKKRSLEKDGFYPAPTEEEMIRELSKLDKSRLEDIRKQLEIDL